MLLYDYFDKVQRSFSHYQIHLSDEKHTVARSALAKTENRCELGTLSCSSIATPGKNWNTASRFLPELTVDVPPQAAAGCMTASAALTDLVSRVCIWKAIPPERIWGLTVGRESVRWWKDRDGWLQGRNEVAAANCALVVDTGRGSHFMFLVLSSRFVNFFF